MSLYQPVGDTLALLSLAYKIYTKGFRVANNAPQEFKDLVYELDIFKSIVWHIQDSMKNGGEGLEKVVVDWCLDTLNNDFGPLIKKYEKLDSSVGSHWIRRLQFAINHDHVIECSEKLRKSREYLTLFYTVDSRGDRAVAVQHLHHFIEANPPAPVAQGCFADSAKYPAHLEWDEIETYSKPLPVSAKRLPGNRIPSSDSTLIRVVSQNERRLFSDTLPRADQPRDSPSASDQVPVRALGSQDSNATESLYSSGRDSMFSPSSERRVSLNDSYMRQEKFTRHYPVHLELEAAFLESATSSNWHDNMDLCLYRATWWAIKARTVAGILHDSQTATSAGLTRSDNWNIELSTTQSILDLMKADYILHELVLTKMEKGDTISWPQARLLQNLSVFIRRESGRSSQNVQTTKVEALLLLKTSLDEDLWQPVEDPTAMPDALNEFLPSSRFLEVDKDHAGGPDEVVLFRTFVNAEIGDKKFCRKTATAPYILVLWTRKYWSGFEITLANQHDTLRLNRTMTFDDVQDSVDNQHAEYPNCLTLKFPGNQAVVQFLNETEFNKFISIPTTYYKKVTEIYPRPDEFLVVQEGLESFQGPAPLGQRRAMNTDSYDQGPRQRSYDVRLYNHVPSLWWKMTRRLVICSAPSLEKSDPFCRTVWLPLGCVKTSITANVVQLEWSNFEHLVKKSRGNYDDRWSYTYGSEQPNTFLTLFFESSGAAVTFAKSIFRPFDTGFNLGRQVELLRTICSISRQTMTRILRLNDLDQDEGRGYFAILVTDVTPNVCIISRAFFLYNPNDFDMSDNGRHVTLLRLRQPAYISDFHNKPHEPNKGFVPAFDKVEKIDEYSQQFCFDTTTGLQEFFAAITHGWQLVFSQRAKGVTLGNKKTGFLLPRFSSENPASVQLWKKDSKNSNEAALCKITARLIKKPDACWYTALIERCEQYRKEASTIEIEAAEPVQEGPVLNTTGLDARPYPELEQGPAKHLRLTVDFHHVATARQFHALVDDGPTLRRYRSHSLEAPQDGGEVERRFTTS